MKITALDRPFTLTFLPTGTVYPLTAVEAQRLLDSYPAITATRHKVVLRGDGRNMRGVLMPATRGGGPAFEIRREE